MGESRLPSSSLSLLELTFALLSFFPDTSSPITSLSSVLSRSTSSPNRVHQVERTTSLLELGSPEERI